MKISVLLPCVVLLAHGIARADTLPLPHQKLGLWQQVMTIGGNDTSDQVCLDAAAEAKMSTLGSQFANKTCRPKQITHNPDGSWNVDSICTPARGLTLTSHVKVTGDLNTKFRAVVDSTMSGSPIKEIDGTHQTIITSSWLGPCKAGQKGGDIIMSNGVKINMMGPAAR
jgi:hypothetical protein